MVVPFGYDDLEGLAVLVCVKQQRRSEERTGRPPQDFPAALFAIIVGDEHHLKAGKLALRLNEIHVGINREPRSTISLISGARAVSANE